MISLDATREQLFELFKKRFPDVKFVIDERRSAILEMRIFFNPKVFMEVYVNRLTDKKSFTLIENGKRIWGYDNYRYWHHHPIEKPSKHIQCNEPSLKKIADEIQTTLAKLKYLNNKDGD